MTVIRGVLFDWGDTLFSPPDAAGVIVKAAQERGVPIDPKRARDLWDELWEVGKKPEELAKGRDLSAAAHLCTELGRVLDTHEVAPLLERAARILDAVGLIVWVWDPHWTALRPACTHGYSDKVLAQMPRVRRDADNATAASFRSAQTRIVNGSDAANGAVVVPLMTSRGCVGVLAVELRPRGEQRESVIGLATIFAAQLATLFGFAPLAEAVNA